MLDGCPLRRYKARHRLKWGRSPSILAEVYKDGNLSNGVGLEMSYFEPVEMKKPTEKGPRGQCEALLIEGIEHDHLVRVLRREFFPIAAPPPGDLLL